MPIFASSPESVVTESIAKLDSKETQWLCLSYHFEQYYLSEPKPLELIAIIEIDRSGVRYISVGEHRLDAVEQCANIESHENMRAAANKLEWPVINCREAIKLEPISIAKPWGQEIWYTGIEARGQSKITDGRFSIPIPWLLSAAPTELAGPLHQRLNLLKILDPLPEPVFGDLYFELHEEKQEVYVVTNVSPAAWPDQRGKIRIGFDQSLRAEFESDELFVEAFTRTVKQYESIRRKIDEQLDLRRRRDGIGLNHPVPAAQTKRWLATVDEQLLDEEKDLRAQLDSFKGSLDLCVGDVLKVPCFTPHSLMHGVRTIEFQTPVYERKILAFAQKVLTQNQWDTDAAVDCMKLDDHQLQPLAQISKTKTELVEEVVDFSDFTVLRITLAPNGQFELPLNYDYALAIGVKGGTNIANCDLAPEQAVLLPRSITGCEITNSGDEESVLLVSLPK